MVRGQKIKDSELTADKSAVAHSELWWEKKSLVWQVKFTRTLESLPTCLFGGLKSLPCPPSLSRIRFYVKGFYSDS